MSGSHSWLLHEAAVPFLALLAAATPVLYFIWFTIFKGPSARRRTTRSPSKTHNANDEDKVSIPFFMGEVAVSKILVHPIKSCRGISLTEARYTPEGLENDRKWSIINAESHEVITAREVSKMVLITPTIKPDAASPHGGSLIISFPKDSGSETFSVPLDPSADLLGTWNIIENCTLWGSTMDAYVCERNDEPPSSETPSNILSSYCGRSVHLVMKGPKPRPCDTTLGFPDLKATTWFQDGFPLLVASEESLQKVQDTVRDYAHKGLKAEAKIGGMDYDRWRDGELKIERFRPNIVLKGSGVPFGEDYWREIVVSPDATVDLASAPPSQTMQLVSKCARCLLPNVDVATGVRDAAVPFKVLMKFRAGKDPARMSSSCFGCNALYGGDGVVHVGDHVRVKTWAGEQGV